MHSVWQGIITQFPACVGLKAIFHVLILLTYIAPGIKKYNAVNLLENTNQKVSSTSHHDVSGIRSNCQPFAFLSKTVLLENSFTE